MKSFLIFVISILLSTAALAEEVIVTTFAGSGVAGAIDETTVKARFNAPSNIAVDSGGNIYVADTAANRIRKITSAGVVTTLAGSGTAGSIDDNGTAATFNQPGGVAVDSSGNVYVADTGNHKIRKITSAGVVTTLAGDGNASWRDANGTAAQLSSPNGVAVDAGGTYVYVADTGNNRIRKITSAGVVTTMAGSGAIGYNDGNGVDATFWSPASVAVDTGGNLYVADSLYGLVRRVSFMGVVTTFAGANIQTPTVGLADGLSTSASFNIPRGIAVDSSGNIYVADTGNNKIRKITQTGAVFTLAGSSGYTSGYADGPGTTALFSAPRGVAVSSTGIIYVSDASNNRIRKIITNKTNTAPSLAIFADKSTITKDDTVNFFSAASDSDGSLLSYLWDFGDGITSSSSSPSHQFVISGTFTVSCKIMDNEGSVVTKTTSVVVSPPKYPPTLIISQDKTSGAAPLTVSFLSAASDADGSIKSVSWNFGDGNITDTNATSPTHIFTRGGDFNVTCTAVDDSNLTTVRSVIISVQGPRVSPVLTISADKSVGILPFKVSFSASASTANAGGTITSFSWSFGEGNSSSGQNVSYTYQTQGTYEVVCTVTDSYGFTSTQKMTIVVAPRQVTLQLTAGWNLISIPAYIEVSDMSIFGNNSGIYIYSNNDYIKNPSKLKPSQGFWIKMNESKTVTFTGAAYTPDLSTIASGWNLLGTGSEITYPATMYSGKTFFTYTTATSAWNQNPTSILPGQGFWIK